MDGVEPENLGPAELLTRVRDARPEEIASFASQIAHAIVKPARGRSMFPPKDVVTPQENVATPREGNVQTPARAPSSIGNATARCALLAYQETLDFDRTGAVTGLASGVAEATHQLHEIFGYTLRFDVAKALMRIYTARWPEARSLAIPLPMLRDVDGPQDGFRDDRDRDIQFVRKPGAAVTIVVFTGLRHAFGIQLNVLHHGWLARHKVNVIYLRDFSQNLYLTGVGSLGHLKNTCAKLRAHFARLGTRKLVFIGNSGGVFGALYYGSLLDADKVLLFAGPTSLDIGVEESEKQSFARLMRRRAAGKIGWPNLREAYAQRTTPVSVFFGDEHRVDRMQAENLAGLPNVELHPVPSKYHFVIDSLATSGELERIFADVASWDYGTKPVSPRRTVGSLISSVKRRMGRIFS